MCDVNVGVELILLLGPSESLQSDFPVREDHITLESLGHGGIALGLSHQTGDVTAETFVGEDAEDPGDLCDQFHSDVDSPGGGEHPRAGWTFHEVDFDPTAYEIKQREQDEAGALLMGRISYQEFAPVWPDMTEDFAGYNAMPKYVVSTTITETDPRWQHTTILRTMDDIARLKQEAGAPLIVNGSAHLAQSLAAAGLVDRYHLLTFPVLLGAGKRLFAHNSQTGPGRLQLVEHAAYTNGVTLGVYDVIR